MPGMPSAPRIPIPRAPYMASMPAPPWHRDAANPMVILDRDNQPVATVEPPSEIPSDVTALADAHADRMAIAQAITALPDLLDAARAAMNLMDPDTCLMTEADIRPVRNLLRAALRRTNGLMPDGTPPPDGILP